MRLIDADAIIKEIKERNPDDVSYEDAWAITCIEHAPTIEPERKKGVWLDDDGEIRTDGYCANCSVCGEWSEYLTAYCGNCGAKMEGSE